MCAWITLDKPNREHIFSHFLGYRKGISLAAREGFISSKKYRNDKNILMTHLFCSVSRSCLTLCNPMNCSTPGFHIHHQFPELAQTHVHWVGDAAQPSYPLSSPSPPGPQSFPASGSFSSESVLHIRWPKYWSTVWIARFYLTFLSLFVCGHFFGFQYFVILDNATVKTSLCMY